MAHFGLNIRAVSRIGYSGCRFCIWDCVSPGYYPYRSNIRADSACLAPNIRATRHLPWITGLWRPTSAPAADGTSGTRCAGGLLLTPVREENCGREMPAPRDVHGVIVVSGDAGTGRSHWSLLAPSLSGHVSATVGTAPLLGDIVLGGHRDPTLRRPLGYVDPNVTLRERRDGLGRSSLTDRYAGTGAPSAIGRSLSGPCDRTHPSIGRDRRRGRRRHMGRRSVRDCRLRRFESRG